MSKVSTIIHFPLGLGFEDYSFLNEAIKDFGRGLDSIQTELDMYFDGLMHLHL